MFTSEKPANAQDVSPRGDSCAAYDKFAWLFDREWSTFALRLWPVLKRLALRKVPPQARILDLCCGTGQLARVLSEAGYRVTGMDGSPEMLRRARENAPQASFILGDARDFHFSPHFAAVFCTFDSLNHVLTAREVRAVFQNVQHCLLPGGKFLFDLNTREAYLHEWSGYLEVVEKDDYFYVNRAGYEPRTRLGYTHCTFFRRADDRWERADIRLIQRCHSLPKIEADLREKGLGNIHKYALDRQLRLHTYHEEATRVLFSSQNA